MGLFRALKKGVNYAGRQMKRGAKSLSKAAGKVPLIGKPLKGVVDITITTELSFLGGAMDGERIDKAALRSLKDTVQSVRDVAPYAQVVISMVPGVGTVAAASIAAGLALAQGQPINAIIIAGVRGAVPGGAIGAAAFDVSVSLGRGESIDTALVKSVPGLTSSQKKALFVVGESIHRVASGQRIDDAVYTSAMKQLPSSVQVAVKTGTAIGKGANVQESMSGAAKKVAPALVKAGAEKIVASKTMSKQTSNMNKEEKTGACTAVGLLQKRARPIEIQLIRAQLSATAKGGFDVMLASVVGTRESGTEKAAITTGAQMFTPGRLNELKSQFSNDEFLYASLETARVEVVTKPWWKSLYDELFA
jgi:hypothetical protein